MSYDAGTCGVAGVLNAWEQPRPCVSAAGGLRAPSSVEELSCDTTERCAAWRARLILVCLLLAACVASACQCLLRTVPECRAIFRRRSPISG